MGRDAAAAKAHRAGTGAEDHPDRQAGVRAQVGHHTGETAPLIFNQRTVLFDLFWPFYDTISKILAGRSNHGERGLELVSDTGHKLYLLFRQSLRTLRGENDHGDTHR